MNIGKKIKQYRAQYAYTQEQLADKLGVSAQAVSKWENNSAMPDITLLPALAEIFGVSIDELFDLTTDQKMNRIENRLQTELEFTQENFTEMERFLQEQASNTEQKERATSLLARLYHHRLETYANKADHYARESILLSPVTKDCQWILQKAEGASKWDWNIGNHSKTIEFYKNVLKDSSAKDSPLPYRYLIEELLADHRVKEANEYLNELKKLKDHDPLWITVYDAYIALGEYNEGKADDIMEKAVNEYSHDNRIFYQAASYYAKKCDYEKAIHYYETSFEMEEKPRFTDSLEALAMLHVITGNYEKAIETYQKQIGLLQNEWGLQDSPAIQTIKAEIERLRMTP